mgnify:CR=1
KTTYLSFRNYKNTTCGKKNCQIGSTVREISQIKTTSDLICRELFVFLGHNLIFLKKKFFKEERRKGEGK